MIIMKEHKNKNKRARANKYLICISANVSIYHPRSSLVLIKLSSRCSMYPKLEHRLNWNIITHTRNSNVYIVLWHGTVKLKSIISRYDNGGCIRRGEESCCSLKPPKFYYPGLSRWNVLIQVLVEFAPRFFSMRVGSKANKNVSFRNFMSHASIVKKSDQMLT